MSAYIIRRILISVPLLAAMSFIVFGIIRFPEGDVLAPYRHDPKFAPEEVRKLEHKYHFDRSFPVQYYHWAKNLFFEWPDPEKAPSTFLGRIRSLLPARVHLDMGYSFINRKPVAKVIGERLVNTLLLSVVSLVLVWSVAIPIGTYCAVHQYSIGDKILSFVSFIGMSFPGFFLALVLLYLVSLTGVLPTGGLTSTNFDELSLLGKALDIAKHMVVPVAVIVTGSMAGMQRLMRGNMLEVLRKQYVTTARAKGLPENRVIYRHALRNALNPMITIFGYQFSSLLGGVALTEMITSYPGMGSVMLEAVRAQDIYLVMGSMMMGGVLLIVGNLMADVLLTVSDPRISYE